MHKMILERNTEWLLIDFTIAKRDHDIIAAELAEFEDGIFSSNQKSYNNLRQNAKHTCLHKTQRIRT